MEIEFDSDEEVYMFDSSEKGEDQDSSDYSDDFSMTSDEMSEETDYAASLEDDPEIIDLASEEEMEVDVLSSSDSD